jgi:tRNA(fMet)-specific endonuclease VapC
MIVADSDVLIDFLAGHGPAADRVASELEARQLATTAVSRFELLAGARTPRQERAVRVLIDSLDALPVDRAAADRAAAIRRSLERRGAPLAMADCLIAGIVLQRGLRLLTRNVRHFERVEGLRVVTP